MFFSHPSDYCRFISQICLKSNTLRVDMCKKSLHLFLLDNFCILCVLCLALISLSNKQYKQRMVLVQALCKRGFFLVILWRRHNRHSFYGHPGILHGATVTCCCSVAKAVSIAVSSPTSRSMIATFILINYIQNHWRNLGSNTDSCQLCTTRSII